MRDEFKEARDWIKDNLDFSTRGSVSFFETTIRGEFIFPFSRFFFYLIRFSLDTNGN